MIELPEPVIYGLTTSSNGRGYSLKRCGAPLTHDGRYQESQDLFLSPVLDNLAALPCSKDLVDSDQCPEPQPLEQVIEAVDFTFTAGKTPIRTVSQPALRIETDAKSKLVKFIDPTPNDDTITTAFLQKVGSGNRTRTILPTYFAALRGLTNVSTVLVQMKRRCAFRCLLQRHIKQMSHCGGWSAPMSACVMWGKAKRRTSITTPEAGVLQAHRTRIHTHGSHAE